MMKTTDWNNVYKNTRDFKWITTLESERLSQLVGDKASSNERPSFLDIGCGTGQLVRDMYHRGFKASGIDTSTEAIGAAKRSSMYRGEGLNFEVGDALMPYTNTYDLIVCKYVIAFLDERTPFYANTLAAMNTRSVLVIITPQKELLASDKKFIAIDDEVLSSELQHYFNEVDRVASGDDWWYLCRK